MYFLHWKGSFQMKNQEPLENEACFMLPASLVTQRKGPSAQHYRP